jgi:hypothetical protein
VGLGEDGQLGAMRCGYDILFASSRIMPCAKPYQKTLPQPRYPIGKMRLLREIQARHFVTGPIPTKLLNFLLIYPSPLW